MSGGGYGAKFGYVRDAESGFYLCTLRYYDPSAGRWITRDPIGYAGGGNLYGYVGNDPVNRTDPRGLAPKPKAVIGIGGINIPYGRRNNLWGQGEQLNADVSSAVIDEALAAKKYLEGKGYDVRIDQNFTIQDFANAAKNPNFKAFMFIGHANTNQHVPMMFDERTGKYESFAPNVFSLYLKGRKLDWVTIHACRTNTSTLRNAFVGPKGSWWAPNGDYDPVAHQDLSDKTPLSGGGLWKNFAK